MDVLAQTLGLAPQELTRLLVLGILLLLAVGSMRLILKLAASIVRIGCVISILILAGVFLLGVLN